MDRAAMNKLGVAAVILLAPGGFIFGAGLAIRYFRRQRIARDEATAGET
jgi:hypothetical protein